MTAFIEIQPKSHRNGKIYVNDEVKSISDAQKWFAMNDEYLKKQAKRKNIESVRCYVQQQYNEIYSFEY